MSAKCRILVVDDDLGVRDLIRAHLQLSGFDVHTARNGVEALARLAELKPAAMILDINMPELDGFRVLEILRGMPGKPVPVLVLSARHASEDVRRAVSLGAKDYLSKPFSESQLLARVSRLLRPPLPAPVDTPIDAPINTPIDASVETLDI